MDIIKSCFTVFFEEPFWVGLYERVTNDKLEVCKITFGAEPKDYEVYQFLLTHTYLLRFSKPIDNDVKKPVAITNPKRLRRTIEKQLSNCGIGTKSQQALQRQREANKIVAKQKTRQQIEAEKQRKFEIKQKKKKEKHKGK
ncbi:MAG: YjdF family protein [Clostridia bacterium]|nr:YjdF family protein [Clostridia bacterium]